MLGLADRPPGSRVEQRRPGVGRKGDGSRVAVDPTGAAGARWAQQLGRRQQLQRTRAAPWDPAEPVEVSAKFASMPTRTAVHTRTVNSTPGMWDTVHLNRFICEVKGLCMG
ncbi:hypothetical protein GCM10010269_29800 [Streptomyces humidus]|uniref:Uncharacterized protein n=1 Tax=Streptomyces humidus TaxID=52259 RepID=A0A918FW71_9ACTN|nr:hypothetical protein GCM10010269_29800 [Streptomyces humidus]